MKEVRSGLARMQVAIIVVILVVAAGIGAYALTQGSNGGTGTGSQELQMAITETDPVNQIDSFSPQNLTVKQGTTVTFAVQNGDDEIRVMTIPQFNVNFTIPGGETARSNPFLVDKAGTFMIYSPPTAPSAVSNGKPGSPVTGYLIVTP